MFPYPINGATKISLYLLHFFIDKHTQATLAKLLNLNSWQTVSYYARERNTPDDDVKVQMAKILDVSLDYLLGLIDEPLSYSRDNDIVLPKNHPPILKSEMLKHLDLLKTKYMSDRNSKKK